ncbi:ATP-binding protein, partial [Candidatus Entotheonella palauensis]|uniref:ATP-binding protein n=1 Tax=Candidatus Entotheonella palauensis TaxID=93172 RepID=UPI0015C45730
MQVDTKVDGWKYGVASSGVVRTIPPFVGRRKQLDWLANRLQEMIAGRPCITLVPGEAGLGKTRLLQEVSAEAERHGVLIYFCRNDEGLAFSHLPFAHFLTWLWERVPEDLKQSLGANGVYLDRFLDPDRAKEMATHASIATQGDRNHLQLLQALSQTVIQLAQRSPILMVVDDLHGTDPASLDVLGYVAFAVADAAVREPIPLFMALTYRPVELESRLAHLIARLQRERICDTLELAGLDESEIYDLLQSVVPARPSHQLIATIREATQGNPLFIQETVHHLKQSHALQERNGFMVTTSPAADLRLPEHVTGAIVSHTQGLSEACRRVLTFAAFLGKRFSLRSLGIACDMSEDELLNLLEEGMRQGLLLSEGQGFRFAHALIQHVLYNEPSVARRQRLHHQIAEGLERLYHNCLDDHELEIAHHFVRAGSLAEGERMLHYARRAGDQACAVSAWGQAAHYYEVALAAAESTNGLSIQERAEFHYRAGHAYQRGLDVGPCLDHYKKSIEAYRLSGDVLGLAQVLMEKMRVHTAIPGTLSTPVSTGLSRL